MGCVHVAVARERLSIDGRLSLTVVRPDGTVRERREGANIMCTNGLSVFAAALASAGLQDQQGATGIAPTWPTALWGAVGDGAGTVAASDTALFSELSRQIVSAGASTPAAPSIAALVTWLFYFPPPLTTWTVTEAGVFANAASSAGSGTLVDHWAFSPTLTVPTTDTLILEASFSVGA